MSKSRPIKKEVVLSGNGKKSIKRTATIDTGSFCCIIPRADAVAVGASPTGRESTMLILGKQVPGEKALVHIQIPSGGCAAVVEAFVPASSKDKVPLLIGQSFLEKVGATVSFQKGHPVLCAATKKRG
jgi:predicted aspartyl protease